MIPFVSLLLSSRLHAHGSLAHCLSYTGGCLQAQFWACFYSANVVHRALDSLDSEIMKGGKGMERPCHLYYPFSPPSDSSAVKLLWNFRIRSKQQSPLCATADTIHWACVLADFLMLSNSPRNLLFSQVRTLEFRAGKWPVEASFLVRVSVLIWAEDLLLQVWILATTQCSG